MPPNLLLQPIPVIHHFVAAGRDIWLLYVSLLELCGRWR